MSTETLLSRRGLFMKIGILFNALVAAALGVPIVGFLLSSVTRGRADGYLSWVPLGPVIQFPEGETRMATFRNPYVTPTDGKTVDTACWVRCVQGINSRFSPSTVPISVVQFDGFSNPNCLCVLVMAALITRTARVLRVRRNAGCSNIPTKCRTVSSPSRQVNCRRQDPRPPLSLQRSHRAPRDYAGRRMV